MTQPTNHPTFSGIHYFIVGLSLLTKPGIKRYVVLPLIINVLVFILLFFVFRHFVSEFNLWFALHVPQWLHWLSAFLWFIFFVSFFLFFICAFVTCGNIVSAPFNSLLSEKIELYLTGKKLVERSLFENIKDVPRVLARQLAVLGYYLPRALLLLILFFIPIVQTIAALFWFLFNAWMMTLTYLDYPSDNHRVSFRDTRIWLKQKRWPGLLFGISVLVAAMLPVLNLIVMPAAVAGATKFWVEEKDNKKHQ